MQQARFWFLTGFLLLGIVALVHGADAFRLERVRQLAQQRYGARGGAVVGDWMNALSVFQGESEEQRLRDVNEYFNRRLRFVDDQTLWGQGDYWATPVEALIKGGGDCEDFAVAKYFSLKLLGIPASKLRITYVRARIGGAASDITQAHMVLTYFSTPDAEPLVLDNLVGEIRPASRRTDLQPAFSFNTEGVWPAGAGEPQPGGSSRLVKWNDLLQKMKSEGFE